MASAHIIADMLISRAALEADEPELLTPLRLQKLLYYVQAWSLAYRGEPMFPDVIEAWDHGPVVRTVYARFKHLGASHIPPLMASTVGATADLSLDEVAFIDSIWAHYKRFSAVELRSQTHAEDPWRLARAEAPRDATDAHVSAEITHASMLTYYRARRNEFEQQTGVTTDDLAAAQAARDQGRWTSLGSLRQRLGHAL